MEASAITFDHILSFLNQIGGIAAFITALVALLLVRSQAKKNNSEANKTDADASKVITDAASQLVEPLRKEIETLRKEREQDAGLIQGLQGQIETVRQENEGLQDRQVKLEQMNAQLVQAIILNIHARRQISGLSCAKDCLILDQELERLIQDTNHFREEIGMQPVTYVKPKRKRKDANDGS